MYKSDYLKWSAGLYPLYLYNETTTAMLHKTLELNFGNQHLSIPYLVLQGQNTSVVGKTAFLSGGIHGDEVNGIELVHKFIKYAKKTNLENQLNGILYIFPTLNPLGFQQNKRNNPLDHRDINRQFGKKKIDSISKYLAEELSVNFFKKCDFGIDCHDSGSPLALIPHSRILYNETPIPEILELQKLSHLFGTKLVLERQGKPNMMAVNLLKRFGVKILTVEIGGNGQINPKFIKEGLQGIKNLLIYHKMIPGKILAHKKQYFINKRLSVLSAHTGRVSLSVKLGQFIHQGDKIGIIYDPILLKEHVINSPVCGFIFSLRQSNYIQINQPMFSILESKDCHKTRKNLSKFTEFNNSELIRQITK